MLIGMLFVFWGVIIFIFQYQSLKEDAYTGAATKVRGLVSSIGFVFLGIVLILIELT